jgi:hypothetical protein
MFHGMFHEIIKFRFETFADIEHRGLHFPQRATAGRTQENRGSFPKRLIAGGADLDVLLAVRFSYASKSSCSRFSASHI